MSAPDLNFRYLNRDGRWLGMTLHGLERRSDGSLALAPVPAVPGAPPDLKGVPEPAGPAGLAIDAAGAIFFTVPGEARLFRVDPCDDTISPTSCPALTSPGGLAVHHQRRALLACDRDSGRVLIFDLETMELIEERGGFDSPVAIAVDEAGNSYVADAGAGHVSKFSPAGDPDVTFNAAVAAADLIQQPAAVAVSGSYLFVLDTALLDVLVFDRSGQEVPGQNVLWEELQRPAGLAVTADSIYVGDNARRRVLRYANAPGFPFAGEAVGYDGPVAALAIGTGGQVLVATGQQNAPIPLDPAGGYRGSGILWSRGIAVDRPTPAWHSLHAELDPLPESAQVRLFFFTGDQDDRDFPPVHPEAAEPFPAPWKQAPLDAPDVYVGGVPARRIWVGVSLAGNGRSSPVLRQLEVRFDQETYLPYLPAVYRDAPGGGDFLRRLLALFESINAGNEDAIARLPELFDPGALPGEQLAWLAAWLAVDLDERWGEEMQRQAIAGAYQRDARRGTVKGLREAIRFEAGAEVFIEEPIQEASWWVLPADPDPCGPELDPEGDGLDAGSLLGFTTVLAPSAPQGAVLGSTAILDRSRLLAPEDAGSALFDELAYRFSVVLYGTRGGEERRAAVARVVEREKPAHTGYHICTFEPEIRVGFQGRIGIDTIVGDSLRPGRLNETAVEGAATLGGDESPRVGRSRLGGGLHLSG